MTAVNLAVSLAAQDLRVILVDGDFRRPMMATIFGVPSPRDGFTSAFIEGDIESVLRDAPGQARVRLLLPTLSAPRQIDQLDAARVQKAFDGLRLAADVVVVDSAPAVDVSDALLLAREADITLIHRAAGLQSAGQVRSSSCRARSARRDPVRLVVTVRNPPSFSVEGSMTPIAIDLKSLQRRGGDQRQTSPPRVARDRRRQ